jgi:hypothetical protein
MTAESLFSWLEQSEPVWRSMHFFDKPGEALSNLPALDAVTGHDPLVAALAYIVRGKRLRELGANDDARRAVEQAALAARNEPYRPLRQHLQALCALEHGWRNYRRGDLDATERALAAADDLATSGAHLKLRGRALSLRSLVRRSQGLYTAALEDLWHIARLFMVEGDLLQLFAVYHNLACLVAAQAEHASDHAQQRAMFRQALNYSRRNEVYCGKYGIGHNSVMNKLLQVGLHRRLGQPAAASRIALEAEQLALESQNFPEALKAHRHRLALLLEGQHKRAAREACQAIRKALPNSKLRSAATRIYADELARLD